LKNVLEIPGKKIEANLTWESVGNRYLRLAELRQDNNPDAELGPR